MKTLRQHSDSTRKPHTVINSYVHDRMFFIITRRAWRTDIASIFETLSHATSLTWKALLLVLQLTSEKKNAARDVRCPVFRIATCYVKHNEKKRTFAIIRPEMFCMNSPIHYFGNIWYFNKFSALVHANVSFLKYLHHGSYAARSAIFLQVCLFWKKKDSACFCFLTRL